MKKQIIKVDKHAVIKKNGLVILAKKATKALLIECSNDYEITEKTTLTSEEKKKLK